MNEFHGNRKIKKQYLYNAHSLFCVEIIFYSWNLMFFSSLPIETAEPECGSLNPLDAPLAAHTTIVIERTRIWDRVNPDRGVVRRPKELSAFKRVGT